MDTRDPAQKAGELPNSLQDALRPEPEQTPHNLFLALGISLKFKKKKKKADEEQCLYIFDPLLSSREIIASEGELDPALCLSLKTKLCFWYGCAHGWGLMGFMASWHCGMCIFFFSFASCLS